MTRIPSAPAVLATRRPMLPTPIMPRVLPCISSRPCQRPLPQSARRVRLSTTTACLAQASMSMMACSATELELEPGAWTTATPRSVAALRSTVSRPTPWRPTTLRLLQAAISDRVQFGLMRKRMPEASSDALMIPASVSSFETTTRASASSCLMPSAWMGPARTTRGFMGLLSESECHLNGLERRLGLQHVPPACVRESGPLVQPHGRAVALRHPQLEPVEATRARPGDRGVEQGAAGSPAASARIHPHANDVAGFRALLVEDAECQPHRAAFLLRHEHHLPTRRGDRLCEPDPIRVRPGQLVHKPSAEGVWRLGQGAEPQLPIERPLTSLELADAHDGPVTRATWSPRGRCGGTRG